MSDPRRIAILDTNILLLLLSGVTDLELLTNFKRVQEYDVDDFQLLQDLLRQSFRAVLTTPHVLAETSNFVDQAPPHRRPMLIETFQRFAEQNEERYEAATALMKRDEFKRLALADTGLVSLSSVATVITTDFRLAYQIGATGGHILNFNHLRRPGRGL